MYFIFLLDDEDWKRVFYRISDRLNSNDGTKLRDIEMKLFFNFVKSEVEKERGPYPGCKDDQSCADEKISCLIKNVFKSYEEERNNYEKSYFKFV